MDRGSVVPPPKRGASAARSGRRSAPIQYGLGARGSSARRSSSRAFLRRVGVVDLEAGAHTISYPAGEWHAPAGLGNVVVAGPELSVLLLDAALCGEPLPRHRPRARAESRLTNGDDLLRVSLTLPLVPPLRFNVSVSCEFTMELGYGGRRGQGARVTVGLEGQFGLSVPRFPGAQRLLSAFLPGYCQASMQQAATGLSESFKASTASPPAG
ncbi:unnamed protein product [Prorocentrum cordatum]|uniref:Uncharacterized protein n=1 Tax=Prorocentrum cordatum TaxID=2364126 RepID=A0ABN9UWU9_9DINO|nr:unnamed protein product [Polarella glacialis]